MTNLDPQDEYWFLQWYWPWAQRTNISLDPDDPRHQYDYRAAWKAGATPIWTEEHQQYRWPDEFKLPGYGKEEGILEHFKEIGRKAEEAEKNWPKSQAPFAKELEKQIEKNKGKYGKSSLEEKFFEDIKKKGVDYPL